jgi:hypothetical protein
MRVSAALPGFMEDLREAVDADNRPAHVVGMNAPLLAHKETA